MVRRTTLAALVATAEGALLLQPRISPTYSQPFKNRLAVPETKRPLTSWTNPETGTPIDYYEIITKPFQHKFFPDLPEASNLLGYDGTFPGPTIRAQKGREAVVRVVNSAQQDVNVHLHGSYSRTPWDGHGHDVIKSNQYKDYYYPNNVQRTLWYHDHTNRKNAINAYKGLVGMYQIVDPEVDKSLGIPSGGENDIPLILSAHYFTKGGRLSDESKNDVSIYGDTFLVNGQIQPFLEVDAKLYRFRVLNAAVSRTFNLTLVDGSNIIPMRVVASDGGYREKPADARALLISMAERWEFLVDFSKLSGKTLMLRTANTWTDTAYKAEEDLMLIKVKEGRPQPLKYASNEDWSAIVSTATKFPSDARVSAERKFKLDSHMDMLWGINGLHHDDPMSRMLMRPPLGTVDKLIFQSNGMGRWQGGRASSTDPEIIAAASAAANVRGKPAQHSRRQMMNHGSMGQAGTMTTNMKDAAWTHAMHLHLVDMKLVSRRKQNPNNPEGRDYLEPYEQGSVKDVVVLGSNEIVEVLAKYAPYPGLYMVHCHNSVHEDRGMIGLFNITRLQDFGYKELDTRLEDPLDERFRARPWTGMSDLESVRRELLPGFAALKAYPSPRRLEQLEDRYWSGKALPGEKDTGMLASGGHRGGMGSASPGGMAGMHGGGGGGGMAGMHGTGGSGGMAGMHGGGGKDAPAAAAPPQRTLTGHVPRR